MKTEIVLPGSFEQEKHWYPAALSATIHPMVTYFMGLGTERIIERYCHLRPTVKRNVLRELLTYKPQFYHLSGADLLHVTTESGKRQMVIIENNSCPSGQKSMPLRDDLDEMGGYQRFIEETFKMGLKRKRMISGKLAVIYDKNYMEASGYAAAMAESFGEPVYLVPCYSDAPDNPVKVENEVIMIRDEEGGWIPIRACFRYLTQQPWNRLPLTSRTHIFNPVITCLAGGRNKMVADKAYAMYNAELAEKGLRILTPETIWDVNKEEIPFWVKKLGGKAVIKVPYSNAGQGVYTIVNSAELDEFMKLDFRYSQFIVQSLIGNYNWSSTGTSGKFYHVGTVPDQRIESYVLDFRMMIHNTSTGYKPINIYARRAKKPLVHNLRKGERSWDYLGTNLSIKKDDGSWDSDTSRLLLMDRKGFNRLGIGLDDLVEAYIQTVLSSIAIDKMAINLFNSKGKFRKKLFQSLNNDPTLINEIMP